MWDESDERISSYLRLPVADVLVPIRRELIIGDIVCFRSPLGESSKTAWKVDGGALKVDAHSGLAVAKSPGQALLFSSLGKNSTTRAEVATML